LCLYLPRTTVYISSQEGTGGICLLGDVVNVFVAIDTFSRYLSVVPLIHHCFESSNNSLGICCFGSIKRVKYSYIFRFQIWFQPPIVKFPPWSARNHFGFLPLENICLNPAMTDFDVRLQHILS
jgi:hypothetical protein